MMEAELLIDFSDGLRRTMERKKITCAELSRRTGLRKDVISKYRSGTYFPRVNNLSAILTGLNVTLYELMRPTE